MKATNPLRPDAPVVVEQRTSSLAANAWILLPAQVFLTGLLTYVAFAAWTAIAGAYTEGLQVVGFAVLSAALTILVFLLGLPLRIVPLLREWWFRHAGWVLALFGVGVAGILLSYFVGDAGPVHYAATDWPLTDGFEPDMRLSLSSLAVLAFAAMHLRLPRVPHPTVMP